MKTKIGNYFDSRIGDHSYSMWTDGYDVCLEEENGKRYFYRMRNYDHPVVSEIPEVVIDDAREIQWSELHEEVKKTHFRQVVKPDGTEAEELVYVYGSEEASRILAEREWVKAHLVYDERITRQLREKLGDFEEIEYDAEGYIIDKKYLVTVSPSDGVFAADYFLRDYQKVIAERKFFGRRVARLAKKAGVPWNIASMVGHLEDDQEAVEILKKVKTTRGTADGYLQWELSCGIGRRTAALKELLTEEVWDKLTCKGQRKTTMLADYLLANDEE